MTVVDGDVVATGAAVLVAAAMLLAGVSGAAFLQPAKHRREKESKTAVNRFGFV